LAGMWQSHIVLNSKVIPLIKSAIFSRESSCCKIVVIKLTESLSMVF